MYIYDRSLILGLVDVDKADMVRLLVYYLKARRQIVTMISRTCCPAVKDAKGFALSVIHVSRLVDHARRQIAPASSTITPFNKSSLEGKCVPFRAYTIGC